MENIYTVVKSEYGNLSIIKTNDDGTVTLFTDDKANADYQAYLASLEETN